MGLTIREVLLSRKSAFSATPARLFLKHRFQGNRFKGGPSKISQTLCRIPVLLFVYIVKAGELAR